MPRLIQLEDSMLVEVETTDYDEVQQISGGSANKVASSLSGSFKKIEPILISACTPIASALKSIHEDGGYVEQAEIEFNFSFEGEGNIYLTKTKSDAIVGIKLILKHSPNDAN